MTQLNPAQGIEGKVVRLSGNQMPGFGIERQEPEAIATAVWIFTGAIAGESPHWSVSQASQHPQWRATILSGDDGSFKVGLPPGDYTLFAQYETELYLNAFSGYGCYQTVQVKTGQMTTVELVNSEAATY